MFAARQLDGDLRRLLTVLMCGTFMSVLDMTVVNVAISRLSDQLDSPVTTVQWVATGYTLALAATVPVSGWLVRRFGSRRIYLWCLLVFTVASAACGLAWSIGALIVFRIVQGAGGGMLFPVGQIIMARASGSTRMRRAMAAITSVVVIAPIVGPILGGVIVTGLSWRWIFLINIPIGIAVVALSARRLPRDEPSEAGPLDALGLVLVAVGLPMITYGLARIGESAPLLSLGALPALVLGIGCMAAFVRHALRVPAPLLELRLYRNQTFTRAAILSALLGAAVLGPYILLPLYYQDLRGTSALVAGLLFAPQGLGAAFGIQLVGRVGDHVDGGTLALIGTTITLAATVPFAFVDAHTSLVVLGAVVAVRGFGIGMSFIPAIASALAVLPPEAVPDASPQLNILQRVGASIATALLTVVLAAGTGTSAYQTTFWCVVGLCVLTVPAAWLLRSSERRAVRARAAATPATAAAI